VSVDVSAIVRDPVSMGSVVNAARATMCRLIGMESVPTIEVFADPCFEEGHRVDPGRRMSDADLAVSAAG
jgi:hypothetical protein